VTASWYGYAASRADNEDVRHSAMDLIGVRQILQSQESEGVSPQGIHHRGFTTGDSPQGIHHRGFTTGDSPQGIHHRGAENQQFRIANCGLNLKKGFETAN
jgi:hypothetical protein